MNALKNVLLRSGFCADSVPALRLCLRALRLPALRQLAIASRIKFTPDILEKLRRSALAPAEKSALFSEAMNLFRSGPTFKTTGAARTPLADKAILEAAPAGALILETGVSDGVSALGLLEARGAARVLLSDRQAAFHFSDFGPFRVFYDKDDGFLSVKFFFLYLCTGLDAGLPPEGAGTVSLLNPAVQERFPQARLLPFDIFTDALPEKAGVIKCANVLNKAYFSAAAAARAVANLHRSLAEGGRLYLCHANPKYRDGEAYVVLRREGAGFRLEAEVNEHELLEDLRSGLFPGLAAQAGSAA